MPLQPSLPPLVLAAWLVACGIGMRQLHGCRAGTERPRQAEPRPTAPIQLAPDVREALAWSGDRALVIVTAHPGCQLLPDTFDRLGEALAHRPAVDVRVLVYEPASKPPDWDEAAFATLCAGLPAANLVVDRDGRLARRIDAERSCHVGLYATTGRLAFAGGVVGGRDDAADALRVAIGDPPDQPVRTPTFGRHLGPPPGEAPLAVH